MALDRAIASKNLIATLRYLKRGAEKPTYYRVDPMLGVASLNSPSTAMGSL
jgi:hypothetical protein